MSRDTSVVLLLTAGVLGVGLGVPVAVVGSSAFAAPLVAVGTVALSVAACTRRFRDRGHVSFAFALLATLSAGLVTLAVAADLSVTGVFTWIAPVCLSFTSGTGLAYALGVARTARQRWIVAALLWLLGLPFVGAAVYDLNNHLETEGIATVIGVLLIPVVAAVAVLLYRHGASVRRTFDDREPPQRPLLVAAALPWVFGVAALAVPRLLDVGLLSGGGPLGIPRWLMNPLFLVLAVLGVAYVAGVRRFAPRAES